MLRDQKVAPLLIWLVACTSSPDEHPPFCNESRCVPQGAAKFDGAAGSSGTVVEQTSPADSGAGVITIQGRVLELDESYTPQEASGTFVLTAPTTGGTLVSVPLPFEFELKDVLRSAWTWLAARPQNQGDLLPGLVAFDSTSASSPLSVDVVLLRRSSLELVVNTLTLPVTLDDTKAQVVLHFIGSNDEPVAGVSVSIAGAERVAYDLVAGYTDDASATSHRGLAFLLNVDASSTPSARVVTLSGALKGEAMVPIQAGAATVIW